MTKNRVPPDRRRCPSHQARPFRLPRLQPTLYRLSDIHGHDPGRVTEALESAWTIAIDGAVWAVG